MGLNQFLVNRGYDTETKQNIVTGICVATVITAVVGVAVGVFALYGAVQSSIALWTQVGAFGGVALAVGGALMMSNNQKHKVAIAVGVVAALALPVIFGSMGAMALIPSYDMLWAATMMCGGVVGAAFFGSSAFVIKDCVCPSS